jgi:hypothetical protein
MKGGDANGQLQQKRKDGSVCQRRLREETPKHDGHGQETLKSSQKKRSEAISGRKPPYPAGSSRRTKKVHSETRSDARSGGKTAENNVQFTNSTLKGKNNDES